MGYPPISFVRGGYVSDMNRLGFKEGGSVSKEELTTSVPISKESQILVDNETVPFVDRIINPQNYPNPAKNKDGSMSTHLLSAELDEEGTAYVFPTKTYKKSMVRRPEHSYTQYDNNYEALDVAKTEGNVIKFKSIEEAVAFSKNYKPQSFLDYYGQKPSFTERMSEDYSKREDASTQSYIDNKTGKISRFRRAINNVGNLAGLGFDVAGNLIESSVDTYLENLEAFAPKGYKKISKDLKDAKTWVLNTEAGQYAIEKATLGLKEYSNWKRDNPQDAQTFESVLNIGMGSWVAKGMASQMKRLKKDVPTTSTYDYKPNSDTPHIDLSTVERYKYLGDETASKVATVNKFFNPDVLNKALQGVDKNTKVVYMTPGQFLTLAKTHTSAVETKKLDRVNEAIDKGIQLEDIPTLTIKAGEAGGSQVIKHDGRHRANALDALGQELIPVRVITKGNDSGKRLSTVTNEDGFAVYSFPNNTIYNRTYYGEAEVLQKGDSLFKGIVVEEFDNTVLIGSKEKASNGLPSAYIELDKTGEWNTWTVTNVMVEGKYLNQKVGKRMYLRAIEEALENKVDYIDSDGLMSSSSIRVWEGLKTTSPKEIERLGFGHLNGMFTVRGTTAGNIEHKENKGSGSTYEQAEDDAMFQMELYPALYHDAKPKKTKVDTKEDIKTNNEIVDELSDYFGASKIEMGQLKNTKKVLSERHKIFPILQRHTYTVTDETQGIYNRIVKRLETGATDSRYYPENTYALTTTKATQERLAKADKKRIGEYKTLGGSNIRLDKISPLVLPLLDNFLARQVRVASEFNIPPLRRVARKSTMENLLKGGMSASMGYGTLELNIPNLNKILAYKETNLLPDRYSKLYESLNTTLNSKGSWATLKELKKTFPDAAENQDITWWEDKGVLTLEDIYKLDRLNITFKYARYKDDVQDITEELDNLHFKSSLESFNAGTKDVVTSEAQTALDIFAIQERLKYATEQMLSAKLVGNTNFPVSLKIIANAAEDSVDGFYQGDLSYNVSDYYALPATQVTNTFNHEAGHHINQLIGMNNRRGRSIFIKTFEYIDNHGGVQSYFDTTKDLKHISTYSKTDLKEWFAESYSYYQTAKGLSTFHTPLGKPKDVLDPLFFELLTQAAKYGKKYKDKQRYGIIFTDEEMKKLDNEYSEDIRILFTNRFKGE